MTRYDADVLAGDRPRRAVPQRPAEPGLVAEDAASGFCGAVVAADRRSVSLADRAGRVRIFAYRPAGFLLDGLPTTLTPPVAHVPPASASPASARRQRTASGSFAVATAPARVARASRIWVEGEHDAALVERIWGADLRVEGIVVEPVRGLDHLAPLVDAFDPGPRRRLGVLADHLVPRSKESRIAAGITSPHVRITGHPYVDVWQAVKPTALGIQRWPDVPRGQPWKAGVARALGYDEPRELWRRVLAAVSSCADVEVPLLRAVEELIDFVAQPTDAAPDASPG